MTRRTLANTIHLECLAFMFTILLAASGVEGKGGGEERARETSRMVGRAYSNNSLCYNSQKQEVNCSRKKGIIVGSVIGTLFVLLGAIYLYGTWSERRKKRKGSSTTEESEPLSNGSRTVSDCEKGVTEARKSDNDGDRMDSSSLHFDKPEEVTMSSASSLVSNMPSYGYDRSHTHLATLDSNRTPST